MSNLVDILKIKELAPGVEFWWGPGCLARVLGPACVGGEPQVERVWQFLGHLAQALGSACENWFSVETMEQWMKSPDAYGG